MSVAALAAGLAVAAMTATTPAATPVPAPTPSASDATVADLPGVPAAPLLAHGRVLVLRPHRLQIAEDGRIRREIPVHQPFDLASLPDVVGDPAFAVRIGPGQVRLSAVLLQRPETVLESGDDGGSLRLVLADTGGAGPARISGTRAGLRLRRVRIVVAPPAEGAGGPVAAGLRYLHESDLSLDDVTLEGLGGTGRDGVPAVRTDGGGQVLLHIVRVTGGGRGVVAEDTDRLDVAGLDVHGLAGDALTVAGGTGARVSGMRADDLQGAGVRLRDADDAVLADVRIATAGIALAVDGGDGVTVRGGSLAGERAAVRALDARAVVLDGVTTSGPLHGITVAARPVTGPSPWRPIEGAGAVALLVLAAGALLEVARTWRRRSLPSG